MKINRGLWGKGLITEINNSRKSLLSLWSKKAQWEQEVSQRQWLFRGSYDHKWGIFWYELGRAEEANREGEKYIGFSSSPPSNTMPVPPIGRTYLKGICIRYWYIKGQLGNAPYDTEQNWGRTVKADKLPLLHHQLCPQYSCCIHLLSVYTSPDGLPKAIAMHLLLQFTLQERTCVIS